MINKKMKRVLRLIVLASVCGFLIGCDNNYDEPEIFGIPDSVWSRMSRHQRETVTERQTRGNATAVNGKLFAKCLAHCQSAISGATGIDKVCFGSCLQDAGAGKTPAITPGVVNHSAFSGD